MVQLHESHSNPRLDNNRLDAMTAEANNLASLGDFDRDIERKLNEIVEKKLEERIEKRLEEVLARTERLEDVAGKRDQFWAKLVVAFSCEFVTPHHIYYYTFT